MPTAQPNPAQYGIGSSFVGRAIQKAISENPQAAVPGRTYIGQGSFYDPHTGQEATTDIEYARAVANSSRFLSAKDIAYKDPGSVSNFYGMLPENIFAPGKFLNKFQLDAVQKGITSGGNAGILADLRSNKNLLGQNPAQAALLRQYLNTGTVPEGLSPQFSINALDWAIREQGRGQQTKKPSFFKGIIGSVIGATIGAALAPFTGGASLAFMMAAGGALGGIGQGIAEKRGLLGIALAGVSGYGIGSLGASLGSFGANFVNTVKAVGFPNAVGQALRSGIGSLRALPGRFVEGVKALPSRVSEGIGNFFSQATPGLYAKFTPPLTSIPMSSVNLPYQSVMAGITPTASGLTGLTRPEYVAALGKGPIETFSRAAYQAAPTLTAAGRAGQAVRTVTAPVARGLGAVGDFAMAHPYLTATGVTAGLAGINALTAPEPLAAEQIPVQPQTGLGTAPPLTGIRSGLPTEQAAPVTDIRVASRYWVYCASPVKPDIRFRYGSLCRG